MAVDIEALCRDLETESTVLTACLDSLSQEEWATETPTEGWTVVDQITHLWFFDERELVAVTDPDRFVAERDALTAGAKRLIVEATEAGRSRTPAENAAGFLAARAALLEAFRAADPAARVPWYGPTMSLGAAVTARIMETWAHGQDVFDALDRPHPVTTALRQVAHIGARALPNSFVSHGREVPAEPVHVRLEAPAGDVWVWGPEDAAHRVSGTAVDFCLVATQRRHRADTELEVVGAVAEEWMSIAQAFAGAAGTGRRPGQFPPMR